VVDPELIEHFADHEGTRSSTDWRAMVERRHRRDDDGAGPGRRKEVLEVGMMLKGVRAAPAAAAAAL